MRENKIFCKGLFCDKWNRKVTCSGCGKYLCNLCNIKSTTNKKNYCPNCYLSVDWNKINDEFEIMLNDLFGKKKDVKRPVTTKV